jgi:hypothetical protein
VADNTTLNTGSGGDVIASDDIGGVKFQRVKLIFGPDGTNSGDVSATNGLPVVASNIARASASWTSATGSNTALTLTVTGYAVVIFTLRTTSTFTGGVLTFEVSDDNSNWYPIEARVNASLVEHLTETLTANDTESWTIPVSGWQNFRIRLSTVITGTGTASLGLTASVFPDAARTIASSERCTGATLANVSSSAVNVTVAAANDARVGMVLVNDSTQILFLKFGATASATSYTYQIPAGETWEMMKPIYAGQIDGIWASANGNARVTELTA